MTIGMVSDWQSHSDEQVVGYPDLGSSEDEDEQPILREENQRNLFLMPK